MGSFSEKARAIGCGAKTSRPCGPLELSRERDGFDAISRQRRGCFRRRGRRSRSTSYERRTDFPRMKEIASLRNPDILLIEGYKNEQGAKVVLLRDQTDWDALQHLYNIQLVVRDSRIRYSRANEEMHGF